MLAIRMQRTGRKGSAQFRLVVQDSRVSPTSGRVVALLGNYDPHSKASNINSEKVTFYLTNGAQPSTRVVRLLTQVGIKLPDWVKQPTDKSRSIRHSEKLRRNQPKETPAVETPEESPVAETPEDSTKAAE